MINKLLRIKWIYNVVVALMAIGMFAGMALPFVGWAYTQRYIADNNTTATKGILLQKSIYLNEYKHLGNGNGIFGNYNRYSRSDRHGDVISVYND